MSTLFSDLRIFQVAVVVHDLDAAAARHTALLGSGPWRVYEFGPHMMQRYTMYGEPATARSRARHLALRFAAYSTAAKSR